jgi:hypothetical protein
MARVDCYNFPLLAVGAGPLARYISAVKNEADSACGGIAKRPPPLTGDKGGFRHSAE